MHDAQYSEDIAACAAAIRQGSRSFHAASLLLPRRIRGPAYAVYAFCRSSDDAVDCGDGGAAALDGLRRRLDRAYRGEPFACAADRAFAAVACARQIPRALPEALIEGFAWDVEGRRYSSLADLEGYASRVAGAVGAIMAVLMEQREASAIARAADLGVAMQLTNIARDVGEDARAGRLYLPLDWFDEAALDPERWLQNPRFSPEIGDMVRRLLAHADALYKRGLAGVAFLPADCRAAIRAAGLIYAEIGAAVAANGFDSVTRRAVVTQRRKLALAGKALAAPGGRASVAEAPALAANRHLVDAVAVTSSTPHAAPAARAGSVDARIAFVIDLIARLERRDRMQPSGSFEGAT